MNAFQMNQNREYEAQRWRVTAHGLGMLPDRQPLPPVDPSSPIGSLLGQRGFCARHRIDGTLRMFCDARGVARVDLLPIEQEFGLAIREHQGLAEPGITQLLEFRVQDAKLAKGLFRTKHQPAAPIVAHAKNFLPPATK